ncbi:MAG: 5-(carboxyamino)imidazole ribonucleotide mutase [Pirellulales bacterium]|jgi:5-(carboxyamino)imidazole ribonucleotide mutase|nr:5-(carboxyamino)imidazole ribonucleotide mutase [Thermoguttaceae bacterium]MDD4787377.1 5-(carboxyamino)imidazole ribonucleotide mutase [Pirellulales bacterium]MDI9443615.1 5-(carboxyamino)imidazole ribonucleotide mutase [Planctomycetota bacterium]NLZ02342.1 5-(carboxyamino)imidazole ribonucleotide mutase [Pirellulaceae bacterium]
MGQADSIRVGIVMGSESDWTKIKSASAALEKFGVGHEVRVISAHRAPESVRVYAAGAAARGIKVIIAAAGGAAHLAGVCASHTTLPVIGIPVVTELAGGLDSLLATVQMPGGVPVATVAAGAGGPRNAGLLAVQILALSDSALAEELVRFKQELAAAVADKNEQLQAAIREGRSQTTGDR